MCNKYRSAHMLYKLYLLIMKEFLKICWSW
jgi:hypothetical protein